ncbi:MAG: hypothetical protein EAX95_09030 [Candidatus Thorarchaeota archaeon]|nr:hypothetical protein [Candidatus Thorarchaeota archaeon]
MSFSRNPLFAGAINELRKPVQKRRKDLELSFEVGRSSRNSLSKLLVVCGSVGDENAFLYGMKAKEIGADFVEETGRSWVLTHQTIKRNYEPGKHEGVLLIGSNKELPATQLSYGGSYGYTDWFVQDANGDGIPDAPVGRVLGSPEAVLYHMDPMIIDSNIAIIFDSQPGRSMRHVEALRKLGFEVEVLPKFHHREAKLLSVSEFILQFSDGMFDSRIHGTPEKWGTHSSVILDYKDVSSFRFEGYPVVYSEACSTAQEGPLLRAFIQQGACYIGATLETLNNVQPFDDWKNCAYADGWKFGFMDLLDSKPLIGEVKLGVDEAIYQNLDQSVKNEIERIRLGESYEIKSDNALSAVEWVLFGNPLRRTTVGPRADFSPGQLIVDT